MSPTLAAVGESDCDTSDLAVVQADPQSWIVECTSRSSPIGGGGVAAASPRSRLLGSTMIGGAQLLHAWRHVGTVFLCAGVDTRENMP